MKAGSLAEPILVGRERELAELMRNLDLAFEGKGTTVFVTGEAGSGKTRLVREFLNAAKKRGVEVMTGWCLSEAEAPYFPFVEAFNSYFSSLAGEEQPVTLLQVGAQIGFRETPQIGIEDRGITAWLAGRPTEKARKTEAVSAKVWKDQVFAGVAQTLHSIAVQSPIILFIEDIHWADSASLALLHYIARTVNDSERILLLATFRSEELTSDAEGHPHHLAETLRLMRREDLFFEIDLSNLNQDDVLKIASTMIGGSLEAGFAEKLSKESRGNALFVIESLRMLSERKSLVQVNNVWRLAIDELSIPSKIKDIILRRLAVLKYTQRRVLDAASIIGEKFDVELLGSVLGMDALEVLETLNVVAHSTSLVGLDGNCYRFDHARSRETLYEELSPPLKRGYHTRVAEKLESTNKNATLPYSDLAYHYAQGGNVVKAVKYALLAGKGALASFSNREAIEHFTFVMQNVGEDQAHAEERMSALEGLGDAFFAISLFKEAAKTFEDLANTGKGVVRLRAFRKAMDATFFQGDTTHLVELVKKAEEYPARDRLESARVRMNKARIFIDQHMYARGIENLEEALRVFEEEGSLWDVAWVLTPLALVSAIEGKLEEGLGASLRAVALFDELGEYSWQMDACVFAGTICGFCGLREEKLEFEAKAIEIGEKMKMGNYSIMSQAYGSLARHSERAGDLVEALSKSLRALEYSNKTDSERWKGAVYADLVRLYTKLGDLRHAEDYFEGLMKVSSQFLSSTATHFILTKAVLFAGKNRWKESNECFKESFEWLSTHRGGTPATEEELIRVNYAWALGKQGRTEEARTQLEEIQQLFEKTERRFEYIKLQANLMALLNVEVGQKFEMRLELANISRKTSVLVKAEGLISSDGFKVISLPSWCHPQNGNIDMQDSEIEPFHVKTVKLALQAAKPGSYKLNPHVIYVDNFGKTKSLNLNPTTITVHPAQLKYEVLPGRIPTGSEELDALLLGGIPEHYAVALTSPSTDEREIVIKKFLEVGAERTETTFYVAAEAASVKALIEMYPYNLYLFLCNPQADAITQNVANVFKLKGVENLTDIDIALAKAFRTLNTSATTSKRICIEIISDALLQHHAINTRRWLGALLPTLKSKGFTVLAVIDPQMHPPEELQSIVGIFDGEIRVTEKETPEGIKQTLRVRKLLNQKYLEKEIILTKERLS